MSNVMNGLHDTKWMCLHITSAFACHVENGCETHSLRFHQYNAKGDVDADTGAHAHATCKQGFKEQITPEVNIFSSILFDMIPVNFQFPDLCPSFSLWVHCLPGRLEKRRLSVFLFLFRTGSFLGTYCLVALQRGPTRSKLTCKNGFYIVSCQVQIFLIITQFTRWFPCVYCTGDRPRILSNVHINAHGYRSHIIFGRGTDLFFL